MLSCFSCVQLFATPWTVVLCPWIFPGKNTGMGCHAFLQEIFLTQGSNPCLLHLLHCKQILYHWAIMEAQIYSLVFHFKKGKKKSLTSGRLYSLSPSGKFLEEVVYTSSFHCLSSCLLINTINWGIFFSWSLTIETLIIKSDTFLLSWLCAYDAGFHPIFFKLNILLYFHVIKNYFECFAKLL